MSNANALQNKLQKKGPAIELLDLDPFCVNMEQSLH